MIRKARVQKRRTSRAVPAVPGATFKPPSRRPRALPAKALAGQVDTACVASGMKALITRSNRPHTGLVRCTVLRTDGLGFEPTVRYERTHTFVHTLSRRLVTEKKSGILPIFIHGARDRAGLPFAGRRTLRTSMESGMESSPLNEPSVVSHSENVARYRMRKPITNRVRYEAGRKPGCADGAQVLSQGRRGDDARRNGSASESASRRTSCSRLIRVICANRHYESTP
jgi:hypothetical protein